MSQILQFSWRWIIMDFLFLYNIWFVIKTIPYFFCLCYFLFCVPIMFCGLVWIFSFSGVFVHVCVCAYVLWKPINTMCMISYSLWFSIFIRLRTFMKLLHFLCVHVNKHFCMQYRNMLCALVGVSCLLLYTRVALCTLFMHHNIHKYNWRYIEINVINKSFRKCGKFK